VLGLPLAAVGARLIRAEAQSRLEKEADTVAAAVEDRAESGRMPTAADLAARVPAGHRVEISDGRGGRIVAGPAPGTGALLAESRIGKVRVSVAEPGHEVGERISRFWLAVALLAVGGLAAAGALAAVQARRLARPLERLAAVSARLGRGDLGARAGRQAIPEVQAVATALDRSASEIARLVERERAFSSNVAHQLRSPITALDMRLEELRANADPAVRQEAEAALDQTDRLRRTTDDLLALARHGGAGELSTLDLAQLARDRVEAWSPTVTATGRSLSLVDAVTGATAVAARAAVEQALDVLIENALRHGEGRISIRIRLADGHAHLVVTDQGAGVADGDEGRIFLRRDDGAGIGLPLARAMLEAGGGRLSLSSARPPAFEIVLPRPAESSV
jgi:signal transduction histidine kinase